MIKYLIATGSLLVLLASMSPVSAQPYGYGPGPYSGHPAQHPYPGYRQQAPEQDPAATNDSPEQIVRSGIKTLKQYLAGGSGASKQEIGTFLNTEIAPYFDFDYMAEWSAGRRYNMMDATRKQAFSTKIKKMFFAALARNLGTYSKRPPRIDVFPARSRQRSKEVTVSARVTPDSGYPLRLDFRFYNSKSGWKIFDVTANGTSAVVYYRKIFNKMMAARNRY